MLLEHKIPMIAKVNFSFTDVRDVAKAHIIAMTHPEAAGNRHIVSSGNAAFSEVAKVLSNVLTYNSCS